MGLLVNGMFLVLNISNLCLKNLRLVVVKLYPNFNVKQKVYLINTIDKPIVFFIFTIITNKGENMKKVLVELNESELKVLKRILNENEVIVVDHIDQTNYEEYIGKTVKVTGDVILRGLGLTKIPINFTEVGWHFDCSYNNLTSLEGSPEKVGGFFDCRNNKLTSLKGVPEKVGGGFACSHNKLSSLEGAPEKVGKSFYCSHNRLTSLEGSPEKVGGNFVCRFNNLTSLEGAPKYVGGNFACSNNPLESFEGKPEYIGGIFEY